jgi:type VI secretion system secreted protein VgrG
MENMKQTPRLLSILRLAALVILIAPAALVACSGSGGCGSNCTVPAFNGTGPNPVITPTPTPIPTPAPLSCTQNTTVPNAIVLGPALAPFALLAGSTITNVGNTFVTYTGTTHDDLVGVSPGTAVTGFYPPATVADGPNSIYAATFNTNTAVPLAAQNALTTAYNAAAGKPANASFPGGQDLSTASSGASTCGPSGNLACATGTFPAGVWASLSSFAIGTGNLTLDGGGNAASIFIFQMPSTLTTVLNGGTSGNVLLVNGASACNIYWQVGSSATLGGATFFGNVLANQSVTINAPSFTGRALARVAAVSIPVIGGSLITNPGGQ